MLTRKQLDLLDFINKRMVRDGVPPSFDEMKEALDLRSKSGIHRLITALEERGFIRRLAHRARAIEIVKLPEALGGESDDGFTPRVIEGVRPNLQRQRQHPLKRCTPWNYLSWAASLRVSRLRRSAKCRTMLLYPVKCCARGAIITRLR